MDNENTFWGWVLEHCYHKLTRIQNTKQEASFASLEVYNSWYNLKFRYSIPDRYYKDMIGIPPLQGKNENSWDKI